MDNTNSVAPVIPAGTTAIGGAAYNPLQASLQAQMNGQAATVPNNSQAVSEGSQPGTETPQPGQAFADLAAKKGFQNPDDLARAYMNLESQNTRVEMGLAELVKVRNDAPSQLQVVQSPELQPVETQADAIKVVENIVKKITRPLEDQIALQNLFLKNPDAPQYAAHMASIVKENPGITWDAAYKVAKFDNISVKAKEEGKKEAYQTIAQKQVVAAGTSQPSVKESRPLDELIHDKSIPFSEVQRVMRERFSQ